MSAEDTGAAADLGRDGVALTPESRLTYPDAQIVDALQQDGRIPFTVLARSLDLHEKSVAARVDHLRESGVIDITVVGDAAVLGYGRAAIIGVHVSAWSASNTVLKALSQMPIVTYAGLSVGRFDLLVEVLYNRPEELLAVRRTIETATRGTCIFETIPLVRVVYHQASWREAYRHNSASSPAIAPSESSISDTDRAIVRCLSENGRASFRSIGNDLGVSEGQVRQRYKRLVDSGIARVLAIAHPSSLGLHAIAWVGIRVRHGKWQEVADKLRRVDGVTYIASCFGRYQFIAELCASDTSELYRRIYDELAQVSENVEVDSFLLEEIMYRRIRPSTPSL